MCGISGFYNSSGAPLSQSILTQNLRLLRHRGPDNEGVFYQNHVGLAHNRLSIVDLSEQGNQPFENEKGVLVYNGELYNYLSINKYLQEKYGITPISTSDTEALFNLIQQEGIPAALDRLEGMFAFAYYDKRNDALYLCRDRIGIKPMFYAVENGVLYFASEYKAILPHIQPEIDEIRALFSVYGIPDKARTFTLFKNIKRLAPGSYARFDRSGLYHAYYFILNDWIDAEQYRALDDMSGTEVLEQFDALLLEAVRKMLMSDAPMGSFVSGGVDSSLISALAAKAGQPLDLFTADVQGKFSEFADAQALSNTLKLPLHAHAFLPEYFLRDLAACTWHMETPVVTHTNAVPFSGVAALAHASGVKAVLTGEGSDELFLGYPRLLMRRYDSLLKSPLNLLQRLYKTIPGLGRYVLNTVEAQIAGSLELLTQQFQRQTHRAETMRLLSHVPEKYRQDAGLSFQMVLEGLLALLWRNDRMGMQASIEARFPFLDEKVIKFALNLPVRYKIGRTWNLHNIKHPFLVDKYIVRQTARQYMPKHLAFKIKNGFPMYGHQYMDIQQDAFKDGYLASQFQLNHMQAAYFAAHTDPYIRAKFFSLEIWARLFIMGYSIEQTSEWIAANARLKKV